MATSTMQATNGGIISWMPLTVSSRSLGRGAGPAEGAGQLRDPEVDEVEVSVDARRPARVGGHDDGLGAGALGDLLHLVAVIVVRGQQHLDLPLPHRVDDFEHVARRGRNSGLRLDIVEAGEPELLREVVPLLVVARHFLAAERRALLEPAAQPRSERGTLVFMRVQELEQLALAIEVGERRAAQDLNELVAVQRAVDPILEVLLACREVVGALNRKSTRLNS